MFSTSDEYETALISYRRAQGRYGRQQGHGLAIMMFVGCAALISAVVLLFQ